MAMDGVIFAKSSTPRRIALDHKVTTDTVDVYGRRRKKIMIVPNCGLPLRLKHLDAVPPLLLDNTIGALLLDLKIDVMNKRAVTGLLALNQMLVNCQRQRALMRSRDAVIWWITL